MIIIPIEQAAGYASRKVKNSDITERKLRSDILLRSINKVGWFEIIWYPFFILSSLVSYLVFAISNNTFAIYMFFSVINLWVCMLANNMVARGNRWGLVISSIDMALYVVLSVVASVWGEVITNTLIYIPLELYGFFAWKKKVDKHDKIEQIRPTKTKDIFLWITLLLVGSVCVWLILQYLLHQSFAIFNAISIMGFLIGTLIRNKRYKYFWYFYMIGNFFAMILWTMVASSVTLESLPMILSFLSILTNNFNGLYIWNKLYKHNQLTTGVLLAKRKININKVIKLKRTYQALEHKMELQPDIRDK